MARLLFVSAVLFFSVPALAAGFGDSLKLKAENLKFVHQPMQGQNDLTCEHKLVNALSQDWDVVCKDKNGKVGRSYSVHLWVSRYGHASGPKVSFEVLYWIDDRTQPKDIKSLGATTWFHLNEETSLHSLQLNQIVDNGLSSLELEIKAPSKED